MNINKKIFREVILKIIIIIILFILIMVESFRLGQKFYKIKNTVFENVKSEVKGTISRWEFKVKIITQNEEKRLVEKVF